MIKQIIEGLAFFFTLTAGITLILILGVLWTTTRTILNTLQETLSL